MTADKYPLQMEAKRQNMTVGALILLTLEQRHWNKKQTAKDLKVSRQGLYNAMDEWNIPHKNPNKPKV